MSDEELRGLPYLFEFWALPHQVAPEGDWKTWVIMGGRGAGKTRAGAEWVRAQVEGPGPEDPGLAKRVALVGETYDQAREVMVLGESGILACSPPDRMPRWYSERRVLVWPNGAEAQVFSATDYEALRGPQFDAAWLDEIGCAAVDKASNEPNKFVDEKSSESSLPKYSSGARDDLIQMQYLRAQALYWSDPDNNPVSGLYGGPMVAPDRMFVWAWDARPYPFFPANSELWSDAGNYATGHWLNGRVSARTLGSVVREICEKSGVDAVDVGEVRGLVRGYTLDGSETARAALQPLLLSFGLDAIEREGKLIFRNRDGVPIGIVTEDQMAGAEGSALVTYSRAPDAESSGRVRLGYVEADGSYELRAVESIFPDESTTAVSQNEVALALTKGEARSVVERWLAEARIARDQAQFSLPPSSNLVVGDTIELAGETFRIDRIEDIGSKQVEAVRVERGVYQPVVDDDPIPRQPAVEAPLPVWAEMLDLPLLTGAEQPDAPWLAATAEPWPGGVAVYSSLDGQGWAYEAELSRRTVMGVTTSALPLGAPGHPQRGDGFDVRLTHGTLASIDNLAFLAGGNVAALSDASGRWEIIQFRDATLIDEDTWRLGHLLRGQKGTEFAIPTEWSLGSKFVLLDAALRQISVPEGLRGITRRYRIGPSARAVDDASFVEITHAASAAGLRPFAPVHLRARPDGAGGHTFSWVRRTRIGGDNWALPNVPLGENVELYQVQVLVGGSVVRSATVDATVWSYDAADKAEDTVSADFEVRVAQISDLYGPGTPARIVINA